MVATFRPAHFSMRERHIGLLVDPLNGRPLQISRSDQRNKDEVIEGELREPVSRVTYPVSGGIPRFVPAESYAANFGFQWNRHTTTQHDNHGGFGISKKRFSDGTKWDAHLADWRILEAGCGSGRFTTYELETGAMVVSQTAELTDIEIVWGHNGWEGRGILPRDWRE